MRSVLVQKYGGSSVADVAKIGLVADKVVAAKRAGDDVVVVVSAMGKATDGLLDLAKSVAASAPNRAGADVNGEIAPFDPPRRELDMLLSTGERVTMALLSIAIQARGCDAISFTGSQSGIITNDRHFDARIIEVRPHRIEDELSRGKIVIVAGYQGMSYRREITTLGRGGSDTTAVALAAALGASRCEIYSDVDGVYSADPRVVSEPVHLPEIDLAMLQEMSEAGAKVLNAQAVEWARRSKITLVARKTSEMYDGGDGDKTRQTVSRDAQDGVVRARAIVGMDKVVHARVMRSELRRFAEIASTLGVPLTDVSVAAEGDVAHAAIPLLNVPDWNQKRAALEEEMPRGLTLVPGQAIVSVVGDGLTSGLALPRFLATLDEASATPLSVFAGALRIGATISSSRLDVAQRALHAAFLDV